MNKNSPEPPFYLFFLGGGVSKDSVRILFCFFGLLTKESLRIVFSFFFQVLCIFSESSS